jgi:uncharacterized protein involved in tellurium resistance
MDNFKIIYRILRYLEKAMDYDEADIDFISAERLKISEQRWISIMEMLVKEQYIEGIEIKRSVDGEAVVSVSSPRITLRGLEYLKENSLMQKAARAAKGIADIIS